MKILIIGGTGIIGKATALEAFNNGWDVTTVGLEQNMTFPEKIHQVIVNKNDNEEYAKTISQLNQSNDWDIVFDVYNLGGKDAKRTYTNFKDNTKHFFIISTTLVYDRSKPYTNPIKSTDPLTQIGELGGYVDHKLELEHFWQSIRDVPWTILRPYHIVGAGCLLGCIPDENRDPKLLEKIKNSEALVLCDGGNTQFNFIHPTDIAKIVLKAAGNPNTFNKAYNAVNPTPIIAKDYYQIIAKVLGKDLIIDQKSIKDIWNESEGWELTTLPHIYDTSDLEKDIGFVPNISLELALEEAIDNYPQGDQEKTEIAIHKRMTMLPRPKRIDWLFD